MNEELKREIKRSRLKYFEVANFLGVSQATLYRKLNSPLSVAEKTKIQQAVDRLRAEIFYEYKKRA